MFKQQWTHSSTNGYTDDSVDCAVPLNIIFKQKLYFFFFQMNILVLKWL